ncbi:DUF1345 domain-containing protein [Catellatospora sp. NPDC049609]|uniref:DUF1345 domain-containing protein n=1 Tax=Catellatospora sp. NPDC049609 TaxID=3155505 RepID=UPI003418452B
MTVYHRLLGRHAPALRRAALAVCVGLAAGGGLLAFVPWRLALVGGWDATALTFLATVWPFVLTADQESTRRLAARDDNTRSAAALLLVAASLGSILAVAATLPTAAHQQGWQKAAMVATAVITILLSWTVVNTVFLLRYADLQYAPPGRGIDFSESGADQPTYLDFAYVAFTIGMTYQVSDTTVRDPRVRRTVIVHALLSYLFGVVIVAGAINVIAGLVR